MPDKTLFIVQQFEKLGKKLVQGRQMELPSAEQAIARADRDAGRFAGVIAVAQTVDTETGEVLDDPVILAHHDELPTGMIEGE